jgi:hypothetical protein
MVPNNKRNIKIIAKIIHGYIRTDVKQQKNKTWEEKCPPEYAGILGIRENWKADVQSVTHFIDYMFFTGEMVPDTLIILLVYVERFLSMAAKAASDANSDFGGIILTPTNYRPILLCCLLLASKVWDDVGLINVDCHDMFPHLGALRMMNTWEREFLHVIDWDLTVPASLYAQYYFRLRDLESKMERKSGGTTPPRSQLLAKQAGGLDVIGANKLSRHPSEDNISSHLQPLVHKGVMISPEQKLGTPMPFVPSAGMSAVSRRHGRRRSITLEDLMRSPQGKAIIS